MNRRAAIVAPARTPVGTFGGSLRDVPVEILAATVIQAVLERSGLDPSRVDDVSFAQSYPNGEVPCVGRWAALEAGLPVEIPGFQVDRRCGGGLQAIAIASMMVQTGAADVVIAGGVESMSRVEHYATDLRWGKRLGDLTMFDRLSRGRERSQPEWRFGRISGMIETAENVATQYAITREAADEFAMTSQRRAAAAWDDGRFDEEVVPITATHLGKGDVILDRDEGIRSDTDMAALARLRTILPDGTVTAGNASQQNDAAAACLVVADTVLEQVALDPMGYVVGFAAAGCEPGMMGLGPIPATEKLLARTGLELDDMGLVEVNEAFASQVLGVLAAWGWDDRERLNVNGSGISLGHPVGATGARIMTTLLYEMQRRGARYGLETMCIGGGQGMAAVFESP